MRRLALFAAAAAFFLFALWLSSLAQNDQRSREGAQETVSSAPSRTESDAAGRPEKLLVPPPAALVPTLPPNRDPLLAALPAGANDPVVIVEANALRHSRLGELFVQCMLAKDPRTFERLQEEFGIDVLKDVDRVAIVGDSAVVVSGFFQRLDPDLLRNETHSSPGPFGEAGVLYADSCDPESYCLAAGTWRDQIVVLSKDPASVRRSFDQLEGRAAPAPFELPEGIAYGEVYGVIPASALSSILEDDDELPVDQLAAVSRRVELHVDAMQGITAVATFQGDNAVALSDAARAVEDALAAARLRAHASGDRIFADVVDGASVVPGNGSFSIQVKVPLERVESWFTNCG